MDSKSTVKLAGLETLELRGHCHRSPGVLQPAGTCHGRGQFLPRSDRIRIRIHYAGLGKGDGRLRVILPVILEAFACFICFRFRNGGWLGMFIGDGYGRWGWIKSLVQLGPDPNCTYPNTKSMDQVITHVVRKKQFV
jgi:hypothetical protein